MTKIELRELMEKAYRAQFLDSVELLFESNKDYVKSDYYKKTRIPLTELYKNYAYYRQGKNDLQNQIEQFFIDFNIDMAIEKVQDFLNKLVENDTVKDFFNQLMENFDAENLEKFSKQLEEVTKNLKK